MHIFTMFFNEEHVGGLANCLALAGVFPAPHVGHVVCDTWLLLNPLGQHDRAGIDFDAYSSHFT